MHAYDDAIAEYKKAIVMDPGFALAHSNLGNAYQQKGDMASAIRGLMVRPLPVEPVRTRSS
jgi:tetratricopeptide (TPR) repeat protein